MYGHKADLVAPGSAGPEASAATLGACSPKPRRRFTDTPQKPKRRERPSKAPLRSPQVTQGKLFTEWTVVTERKHRVTLSAGQLGLGRRCWGELALKERGPGQNAASCLPLSHEVTPRTRRARHGQSLHGTATQAPQVLTHTHDPSRTRSDFSQAAAEMDLVVGSTSDITQKFQ